MEKKSRYRELADVFLTRHGQRLDWPAIFGILFGEKTYAKLRPIRRQDLRRDYATYIPYAAAFIRSKGRILQHDGWGDSSVFYTITDEDKAGAISRASEDLENDQRRRDRTQELIELLQDEGALPSNSKLPKLLPPSYLSHVAAQETSLAMKKVILLPSEANGSAQKK